jgi:hypothetical protein
VWNAGARSVVQRWTKTADALDRARTDVRLTPLVETVEQLNQAAKR